MACTGGRRHTRSAPRCNRLVFVVLLAFGHLLSLSSTSSLPSSLSSFFSSLFPSLSLLAFFHPSLLSFLPPLPPSLLLPPLPTFLSPYGVFRCMLLRHETSYTRGRRRGMRTFYRGREGEGNRHNTGWERGRREGERKGEEGEWDGGTGGGRDRGREELWSVHLPPPPPLSSFSSFTPFTLSL